MEVTPFRKKRRQPKLIEENRVKDLAKYALNNFLNRDVIYEQFKDVHRKSILKTVKRLGYIFLTPNCFKVYFLRYIKGYSLVQIEKIIKCDHKNLLRTLKIIKKKIDESNLSSG